MNQLRAKVTRIDNHERLHLITFDFHEQKLVMMGLALSEGVREGVAVRLGVNPTHITLAKKMQGSLSDSNILTGVIVSCENGVLLSNIVVRVFDTMLEVTIMREASQNMALKAGDNVDMFIKASDLFMLEVLA